MYLNSRVKIPSDKGKISIKSVRGYQYVYYQYDTNYRPERKYNMPKRTTIGKVCKDDPSMMNPNPSYLKFYPDAQLPEFNDSGRSSCLRVGTWIVIDHLIHHYHLQGYLKDVIGEKFGLFLDLAAYTIVTENNAAQYYPDYAYDHPLFTRDMKIYSDSSVSTFLHDLTRDESISFLNAWNEHRDHRSKIYISYDSTNKKCQAGNIELVEVGHSKTGQSDTIFNMSIAYDRTNREPLFYEAYSGSITDVTQLTEMIEKAKAFGYKHAGFILDRGYFSEANIRFMDDNGYDFVIMVKGMKKMVSQIVLANKGSFEEVYSCMIHEYGIPGTTIAMPVFRGDSKDRYVHIYFNESKAAQEKAQLLQKIDVMEKYLKKHQGDPIHPDAIFSHYFDLIYYHEGQEDEVFQAAAARNDVIEQEMKLCGYFCIITSEKMNAKDALLLYKSRDDSEKLFRGDKSYLGERAERVYTIEPFESKIFIEFVALVIRSGIYTSLLELMKEEGKRMNYMTIPAAVKELEKLEMIRYADGDYHLDHAITKTQKEILKAFGMDERTVREKIKSLSVQLSCLEKEYGKKNNRD